MTVWTVQCGYAAYFANTVEIEADTFDAALEQAIERANESAAWRSLDDCGPTFIDAAAEGADADPWRGGGSALPIPLRFTERGEPATVTVIIKGGMVQDLRCDRPVNMCVHDYDIEGLPLDTASLHTDESGDRYAVTILGVQLPPDAADHSRQDGASPEQE